MSSARIVRTTVVLARLVRTAVRTIRASKAARTIRASKAVRTIRASKAVRTFRVFFTVQPSHPKSPFHLPR